MILLRDAAPWRAVMRHPEVAAGVGDFDLDAVLQHPAVVPLWCGHGGFLFHAVDHLRFTWDLHAMFTPEGWGKHVAESLKQALGLAFADGAQVITVIEVSSNARSRPPRSFGFRCVGDFRATAMGRARTWILTQAAWRASPAYRRAFPCLLP